MTDIRAEILERLRARDALVFGLSDTLDVKASIALVLITFLATQSADFMFAELPTTVASAQALSVVSLAAAAVLSLAALWPRDHATEPAEELEDWLAGLEAHYSDQADPVAAVRAAFQAGMVERVKERIATNVQIQSVKSRLVALSFKCSAAALVLNLATLVWLAVC